MGLFLGSYGAYCGLNYQDSECMWVALCNWKVFSISISILFIALELSHHGKMPNNTPFFWQINVKNLMPQAYYMLCRKFPDSYNKDSQAPYQLFRADENCSYLQELWGWMSELMSLSTIHVHPFLCAWYLSYILWPLFVFIIWTGYPWQLQNANKKNNMCICICQLSQTGEPKHITCYWGTIAYIISNKSTFYIGILECVWGQ